MNLYSSDLAELRKTSLGPTDDDRRKAEHLYKSLNLPSVRATGGWRREYAEIAKKMGYAVSSPSTYFSVYKDGKLIGHVSIKRGLDLVLELVVQQKVYDYVQARKNRDRLRRIGVFAVERELPQVPVPEDYADLSGALARHSRSTMPLLMAFAFAVGGCEGYPSPAARVRSRW